MYCIHCGKPLEDHARFCVNCGIQVAPQAARAPAGTVPAPPRKKGALLRTMWLWLPLVLLITIGLLAARFVSRGHEAAVAAMREMDFALAQQALARTLVGERLYADDAALIRAGLMMEAGDYEGAIRAFAQLGGHENADECAVEAKYRQASSFAAAGDRTAALLTYREIAPYRDSGERAAAIDMDMRLDEANALIAAGRDAEAMALLQSLAAEGNARARRKVGQLEAPLYEKAAVYYRRGAYEEARALFVLLSAYGRSADYLALIAYRQDDPAPDKAAALWDTLVPLIDLEDVPQIILNDVDMLFSFLTGDWATADGGKYFTLTPDAGGPHFNVRYNLPWFAADGHFAFEPGGLYVETDARGTSYATLRFSILDRDTAAVYCFRDGNTYILRRK